MSFSPLGVIVVFCFLDVLDARAGVVTPSLRN